MVCQHSVFRCYAEYLCITPSVKVFVNTAQYVKHIDNVKVKLPRIATSSKVTKAAARKHIL